MTTTRRTRRTWRIGADHIQLSARTRRRLARFARHAVVKEPGTWRCTNESCGKAGWYPNNRRRDAEASAHERTGR